jgi:hypothetical protein
MIDHKVMIGGEDVSEDVIKINVQQNMDTDSDPGKFAITLANPAQKYTMRWLPQKTEIVITLYNWVYNSENERTAAGGRAEAKYLVATGSLTELKANADEAVVSAECDMGHLADAIAFGGDYNSPIPTTPRAVLEDVLARHDKEIVLDWDDSLKNDPIERKTYGNMETYQDVIEDIRDAVGAVAYFSEEGILNFRDPFNPKDTYDLDGYVTNPDKTASIMAYRNVVVVIGDQSLAEFGEEGIESPGSVPIIGTAMDLDSIGRVGMLVAPAITRIDIKTQGQADELAAEVLKFYKMYRNAQTVVEVEGILPPIQSIVTYTPFLPVSDEQLALADKIAQDRLADLQELENKLATQQDRNAKTLGISSKVRGVVINREIDYSVDGMHAKLTISPGLMGGTPITDEDVADNVFNPDEV